MTHSFQFNDIREAVYRWMSEEIHWKPGDTRLGNVLHAKFWLRIQSLKKMLSDEKQFEPARDVREHWEAAVSQLNNDTLYDYLNTSYADKLVSPDYVCDDRWPETGPDRVYDFLHSLGAFYFQFQTPPAPPRYSLPRDPKEWMKLVEPAGSPSSNEKAWQRFKNRNLQHLMQNAVKRRQWSMSEVLANQLHLRLDEFSELSKVD